MNSRTPTSPKSKSCRPWQATPAMCFRSEIPTRRSTAFVVPLSGRDFESADIISMIEDKRRQSRCRWRDFAILYRSHFHRDEIARELAEKGIPFTIENMDVMDTPEVRDLLACLGAIDSIA